MLLAGAATGTAQRQRSASDAAISGELKQWHKVTLTLSGRRLTSRPTRRTHLPDYRMTVTFAHESGTPTYRVPGYFAGDGDAANSSATSGKQMARACGARQGRQMDVRSRSCRATAVALAAAVRGAERIGAARRPVRHVSGGRDRQEAIRIFELAADCSTPAGTIFSSPAAANTS
jgi:hypothetical protein